MIEHSGTKIVISVTLLVSVFALTLARADGYISFSPGPGFTTRVNAPWGSYLIEVSPGGGFAWVGTEEEYTTRKAAGVAGGGYKEMYVEDRGSHDHLMINTRLPSVRIGQTILAEIQGTLSLDDHGKFDFSLHAPRERIGYEYVLLSWTPNRKNHVRATLSDAKAAKSFEPFYCDSESCRYQIPDAEAGVPLLAVFTIANNKPGALPIRSLAHMQYEGQIAFRVPADTHMLKQLHLIDPSVPTSY